MPPAELLAPRPTAPVFDFQVNGFGGVDFQSPDLEALAFEHALGALREHGTDTLFVTLITDTIAGLIHKLRRLEFLCAGSARAAAMVLGYHLEGPWLNPAPGFRGAHPAAPMHAPSITEFEDLQAAASGRIRLITLAPEWPGSAEVIAHLHAHRVHIALGHTDAQHHHLDAAIAAGARFCTHLGNGVPQRLPRHDNIIQRLLARDELIACFIPDGIHVPPWVLRNWVRAKPPGQVLFTTDAMAAAAAPPGIYTLGALAVQVGADGVARGPDGGFAGSTLTPAAGIQRTAALLGLSTAEAQVIWSERPAGLFGLSPPALASATSATA